MKNVTAATILTALVSSGAIAQTPKVEFEVKGLRIGVGFAEAKKLYPKMQCDVDKPPKPRVCSIPGMTLSGVNVRSANITFYSGALGRIAFSGDDSMFVSAAAAIREKYGYPTAAKPDSQLTWILGDVDVGLTKLDGYALLSATSGVARDAYTKAIEDKKRKDKADF